MTSEQESDSNIVEVQQRDQNMAIRYRFFNRLNPNLVYKKLIKRVSMFFLFQIMPAHVIPQEMFSILPFDDFKDVAGKQGSLVTM